jgi:hypothetical protein
LLSGARRVIARRSNIKVNIQGILEKRKKKSGFLTYTNCPSAVLACIMFYQSHADLGTYTKYKLVLREETTL